LFDIKLVGFSEQFHNKRKARLPNTMSISNSTLPILTLIATFTPERPYLQNVSPRTVE
jgi:hypothetical protein